MEKRDRLEPFPIFFSDSVDEAEGMLSRSLTGCRIERIGDRKRFGVRMNGLKIGRTSLVYNRFGSDSKIQSDLPGEPVFFVLGTGKPSVFLPSNRAAGTPSVEPVLVANANRLEIDRPADSGVLTLRVALADLEEQVERLTDRHHRGGLVFDRDGDMGGGSAQFLKRLMGFLIAELESDPKLATSPVFRSGAEEMLLGALLALPHNRSDSLSDERAHEISPGLVNRAQEFMRAKLGEAITVNDLLRVCECSRSALFSAFRNARGFSPIEFLTEQRLQAARRDLLEPGASTSVTSVGVDCGFVHLGRFASAYRKRFGESPSATLKRARMRKS